jgi:hypothetical protein
MDHPKRDTKVYEVMIPLRAALDGSTDGHTRAGNGGREMDHQKLEEIGEKLRSLGHDRREVVHEIMAGDRKGDARRLYQELDRISSACISLMQQQRNLIAGELNDGNLS